MSASVTCCFHRTAPVRAFSASSESKSPALPV
ncbi:hypothetical protein J2S42_001432 [Catenuloplanes indicus]|uniref:Uncharacterized protein n=1 Tax=Catenuloplanes indicus TaxID=137267 RepID=A0AAE3VVF7_9ACTN|nr:hypothetical protein [Catenuloplanes indicus]